jgi:hypothetical protein
MAFVGKKPKKAIKTRQKGGISFAPKSRKELDYGGLMGGRVEKNTIFPLFLANFLRSDSGNVCFLTVLPDALTEKGVRS